MPDQPTGMRIRGGDRSVYACGRLDEKNWVNEKIDKCALGMDAGACPNVYGRSALRMLRGHCGLGGLFLIANLRPLAAGTGEHAKNS
jgi:hypothetical protein